MDSLEDKIEAIMRGNYTPTSTPTNGFKRNISNVISESSTPSSKAKLSFDATGGSYIDHPPINFDNSSNIQQFNDSINNNDINIDIEDDKDNNSLPLEYSDDENNSNRVDANNCADFADKVDGILSNDVVNVTTIKEEIIQSKAEQKTEDNTPQLLPWQQILLKLGVNPIDVKANPVQQSKPVAAFSDESTKDRDVTVDTLLFGNDADSGDSPIIVNSLQDINLEASRTYQSEKSSKVLHNDFHDESSSKQHDTIFEVQLAEKDLDDEIDFQNIHSSSEAITINNNSIDDVGNIPDLNASDILVLEGSGHPIVLDPNDDSNELSQTIDIHIPTDKAVHVIYEPISSDPTVMREEEVNIPMSILVPPINELPLPLVINECVTAVTTTGGNIPSPGNTTNHDHVKVIPNTEPKRVSSKMNSVKFNISPPRAVGNVKEDEYGNVTPQKDDVIIISKGNTVKSGSAVVLSNSSTSLEAVNTSLNTLVSEKSSPRQLAVINISPPRSVRKENNSSSSSSSVSKQHPSIIKPSQSIVKNNNTNTPSSKTLPSSTSLKVEVSLKEASIGDSQQQQVVVTTPIVNKRHSSAPPTATSTSASRPKSNLKERYLAVTTTPEVKEKSIVTSISSTKPRNTTPSRYLDPKPIRIAAPISNPDYPITPIVQMKTKEDDLENIPTQEVNIAVRVRPFHSEELRTGQRRTISKYDSKLLVVDPKSFNDTPDAVAIATITMNNTLWAQCFEFERCFWEFNSKLPQNITNVDQQFTDQKSVHKAIGLDIVEKALNGISCSCFAYGHTNTGKTYTLFGSNSTVAIIDKKESKHLKSNKNIIDDNDQESYKLSAESGLIQRVFHDIISLSRNYLKGKHRIYISFLEIYNEKVRDLLIDDDNISTNRPNSASKSQNYRPGSHETILKIREHPSRGPYVENLNRIEVFTPDDAFRLIVKGYRNRTTAHTIWNAHSSRSHAIVTLEIVPNESEIHSVISKNDQTSSSDYSVIQSIMSGGNANEKHSNTSAAATVRVQMIDLAGSEKETLRDESISSINTESSTVWSGSRPLDSTPNKLVEILSDKEKNELKLIRRSLSTLGFIIKALSKGASIRTLPYRDSALTFLLRDSLSGHCHTTMLATISPAHGCYEETLSTLRYAERLYQTNTTLNQNSKKTNPDENSQHNLINRELLFAQFERFHQKEIEINLNSINNNEALRHAIQNDFQQPSSQLQKPAHHLHYNIEALAGNDSSYLDQTSTTFVNPVNGNAKPLSDVNNADLDQLRSSYRTLTSELLELQIDLDAVRTDRDMLKVELKGTKDMLFEMQDGSGHQKQLSIGGGGSIFSNKNQPKLPKTYEKEYNDAQVLLKRKDENIERLLKEIADEKQARFHAEQGYHARTKEFLGRFDTLKRENKELLQNLTVLKDKYQSYTDEKRDYSTQIEKLKSQVKILTQSKDLSASQIDALKGETMAKEHKLEILKSKAKRTEELDKINLTITAQLEKCKSDIAIMTSERNSLVAMVEQKEKLLSIQSQQSEMSIKMLQQRQKDDHNPKDIAVLVEKASKSEDLEKVVISLSAQLEGVKAERDQLLTAATALQHEKALVVAEQPSPRTNHINNEVHAYAMKLQQNLSDLLTKEGEIIQNEIVDTYKLTATIQDLRQQLIESEKCKSESELIALEKDQIAKELHDVQQEYNIMKMSVLALEQKVLISQQELQIAKNPVQQLEAMKIQNQLQSENIALKDQIIESQNNLQRIKTEANKTLEDMQREYATLWKSVQDLNKLDEQKDKSIKDIIADRDTAVIEKRKAFEALATISLENNQLKQELDEIDHLLLAAVQKGEYKLSPAGKNKSLVIQNVSDSVMSGVARRKNEVIKPATLIYQSTPIAAMSSNHPNNTDTRNNYISHSNHISNSNISNSDVKTKNEHIDLMMSSPGLAATKTGGRFTEAFNEYEEDSPISYASSIPTHSTHGGRLSTGYSISNGNLNSTNNLFSNLPPPQLPFEQQSSKKIPHKEFSRVPQYNAPDKSALEHLHMNGSSSRYHNEYHPQENEFDYQDAMNEAALERQIEELSGYLEDETKQKQKDRMRSSLMLRDNNYNSSSDIRTPLSIPLTNTHNISHSNTSINVLNHNKYIPLSTIVPLNKNKSLPLRSTTPTGRLRR